MVLRLLILPVMIVTGFGEPDSAAAQAAASRANSTSRAPEARQDDARKQDEASYLNLSTKTLGGKQFWTDLVHFHGYRIQQNVFTKHHRLLDPNNVRLAWGGRQGCQRKLERIAREQNLSPVRGRVLIVMHGLTRTRTAMNSIAEYIAKNSDLQVLNVSYASSRSHIEQHALALDSIIRNLPEVEEINFLGHSMGSIVVRYYLGTIRPDGDARFKRMVMLAPPNHGSRLARKLQDNLLFKTFWGASGQQLSRGWGEIESKLGTPRFEFGIIAGGQEDESRLNNPLLDGKNDLVVTVDETRLAGARDFYQEPLLHSTMMNHERVHQASLRFLQNGFFVSEAVRQPLTRDR